MTDRDQPLAGNPYITPAALEALHASAYGWAVRCANGDAATGEDLLQMAYAEIIEGRARFEQRSTLKTWLFAVIRRLAAARFRRQRRWLSVAARLDSPVPAEAPASDAETAAVWQAVKGLPARQRDVIELVFCRDCTLADVALILDVSIGTVRQHYDRAKRALASTLGDLKEEIA